MSAWVKLDGASSFPEKHVPVKAFCPVENRSYNATYLGSIFGWSTVDSRGKPNGLRIYPSHWKPLNTPP